MKHPVDTSTWGEFKVGELFDDIGRGTRIKKQDRVIGETPLVTAGYENQGVAEYIKENKELFQGPLLTIDMFGNAFARDYDFYADDNILVFKSSKYSFKSLLFIASALTYLQTQYDYTNQFRQQSVPKTTVKLPLKQGTNLVDYSQEDIDWDYMESFMSRVQDAAKERLANLPEPGQKSKTPVDVSTWGEFKVGELFEFSGCKQVKSQHNLIETDKENGIPFVVQSNANNMVKCYVTRESLVSNGEMIYDGNSIMLGVMTPVASYQEHEFGASQSIALRAEFLNPLRGLFIATVIKSVIEPKYNYANIPGIQKYKNETIPLPLKQGTNPSDYSQDDIDWDYMEQFMSQFQNLAKNRVERLT